MNKNNENKLVPRLRFPEFQNETWERKTIDEICQILNNLRKPLSSNLREKGEYPYYGASGIIDFVKDFIFNERLLLIGEDGAKWGAYEKTAFIAEGKYWVNNHAHVLKPIGVVDTLLENYLVKLDLSPFITGTAPPKLTLGKLKSIPVPIPNCWKEQQKIASCLSSLDEVIAGERQKLALLQQHKKGLLQQLFPQEGETVPTLRFKEFEDSGEWEEKRLGEVAEKRRIKNKNVAVSDVFTNSANAGIVNQRDYFDKDIANQNNLEGYYIVEIDDFIYNPRISNAAPFGPISRNKIGVGVVSPLYYVFRFLEGNSDYLEHFFSTNIWHKYMQDIGNQGARADRMSFSLSDFYQMPILFPCNLKEQQKIASCLSSLDDIITAQTQKIELLEQHKKGLLQGLFPNVNDHG